ncbi:MAG: hypothetical protein HW416_1066 [Chloroflexi bacterium]|nr:hypothetical protein [Chloroflexota bacterium]
MIQPNRSSATAALPAPVSLLPSIAIYVHIPWCASLCPYCDFDKQAHDFGLIDRYVDAVIQHVRTTHERTAHSLYFGGGTPSLLTVPRLARLIEGCRERFNLPVDAEISAEANPSDVVAHKIEGYLRAGITRLSLGVQSLDDDELRLLCRRHTADKARRAVAAARDAGCTDLSVDCMYGLPGQSAESVGRTIEGLVALNPDHVSCYALTLDATTPMGAAQVAGTLTLPDDDAVADQYAALQDALGRAGFLQYELSNWARPGHASIHNLTYWRNGEYVGLGAGASGSFMGLRYKRTPDIVAYIAAAAAGQPGYVASEHWSAARMMRDTVMLGLRLKEGISAGEFERRFGAPLTSYCTNRLADLVTAGVLQWHGDRVSLDPHSYLVCNAVLVEILPARPAEA